MLIKSQKQGERWNTIVPWVTIQNKNMVKPGHKVLIDIGAVRTYIRSISS